ncbi:MFS transporter [Clostridium sp. AF19-22AC]|jgi:putative MFS transporter|uniref:Putative MFS transporter n=1 Tax=Faecalicatena orotica TaxID=1544 RepID=A0A2Y9BIR7_9FIRM|nr:MULTISPECIES: MFS transporter [Clostridia]PWJ23175.1 putative MFS transporter [Faecalicatena orotica]RHR29475.1 MFS transporter [Clostridium sp. AF19-22AC]SSA57912.1 MFS transporter, putative metabolite:H+ symporter [Faecalicatena orotica]
MDKKRNVNIGARLDRLPNSSWHIKMWLVTAFALLVCWSNGIGGAVQNILLNEIHWLEPGSKLLAMWSTTYTAGQLFGALIGGPIGDKIGRKKSILLYEVIHIIAMIGGAVSPNIYVLYVFRLIQGLGLGALLVVLFAGFTEYVPGRNRGTWSSRTSFIGNWAHPICNGIALLVVSTGVSYAMNWRIQFMIPSVLSIIASILVAKKFPESPRWLEAQGRVDEADELMTKIEKEIEAATGKPLPEVTEEPKQVKQLPYSALFKGKLLRRTIVGSLVLIGMNTIQYTLMNWMPSMLSSLGFDTSQSQFMTMFGLFGAPFGIFIASLIMDKIPRKAMGVVLLAIMAVFGIITGRQSSMGGLILWTFLLNTAIYMYVCYASAVYVPEMWPTSAKLSGSGFSNAMGRVSNIFFPFLVTYVANSAGANGVFILISVVAIIIAVSILFLGIETRGESVEDIGNID